MDKRIITYGFLCGGVFLGGTAAQGQENEIKNVILILTDDMGPHASGLGTKQIFTPNIDRLIEQGTTFTQAFSVCASSAPSRSSILTGMYPHSNGHWRNTHSLLLNDPDKDFAPGTPMRDIVGVYPNIQTLPEIFQKQGYYTAIMRKFHLSYPWKYPFTERYNTGNSPDAYKRDINSILKNAGDRPSFIMANISCPHRPWPQIAKQITQHYPNADKLELPAYLPDIPEVRKEVAQYYANIMFADRIIGSILEAFETSGELSRTLIIFTGDQGPGFHRAKASPYYAGSHVPFVVTGPGVKSRQTSTELISLIDILPTVLEALGIEAPKNQLQGESLFPILSGQEKTLKNRDYIFTTHNSHGPTWPEFYPSRAVFDGRYYMIWNLYPNKEYVLPADLQQSGTPWFNETYNALIRDRIKFPEHYRVLVELQTNRPRFELYDIQKDPGQFRNVYGLPEYADIQQRLKTTLVQWRQQTGDTDALLKQMEASFKEPIPFVKEKQRRTAVKNKR